MHMLKTCILFLLVAFGLSIVGGCLLIPMLHKLKFGSNEREEGPASHKVKQGTPTMGGLIFLCSLLVTTLLFGFPGASFTVPTLLCTAAFCLTGFADDYIGIRMGRNLGLKAWQKLVIQFGVGLAVAFWAYNDPNIGSALYLPISRGSWDLGFWYIPLVVFVVMGTTNASNLIDGVDGLCAGVTMVMAMAMCMIFCILGFAAPAGLAGNYAGMAALAAGLFGALLGYLWFNRWPAKVFMGDTGSLALGAIISMFAIVSRSMLLLPIMALTYVATALSVMIQVGWFKLTHTRVFPMAPIHHSFEKWGFHETQITGMYMLVTVILCSICMLCYV